MNKEEMLAYVKNAEQLSIAKQNAMMIMLLAQIYNELYEQGRRI